MSDAALKFFLTGQPGVGKTTLVRKVVEQLAGVPMTGFFTEDVRENGRRVGFAGRTLDGTTFPLAGLRVESPFRLGPYGVTLEGLEQVGVPALTPRPGTRLVVLDEVGKMESFSQPFRDAVERLLASNAIVLATVALRGVGFIKRVRRDPRIVLLRVELTNRDGLLREILGQLAQAGIRTRGAAAQKVSPKPGFRVAVPNHAERKP